MTDPAASGNAERFRAAISQRLGLHFDDAKLGFLSEVLQRRVEKLKCSSDAYLWTLEEEPSKDEFGPLALELTVPETYFFRNIEQFHALAYVALPERMSVQKRPKVLRLLSAGCASGEEAYSIAIMIAETIVDPSWDIVIRAVDLNPAALEKAALGRYPAWAMRETPPDIERRWFRREGREMILADTARAAVKFEARNLVADDPELWRPATYDAIFCRNVMMYFAPDQVRATVARIARSLAPGGFVFLGHAETLRGVSDEFHLRHTHDTFYYARKEGGEGAGSGSQPAQYAQRRIHAFTSVATFDEAWVDTIRGASERVAALIPTQAAVSPANPRELSPSRARDSARALDLLGEERFMEALAYVQGLPSEADNDPEILLLEATLLAHSGQLVAAEEACLRLLLVDELNAGAHYVLALCRENKGDRDRAAEHDRVAAYLDPAFAMPRVHLGLLARRAGDRESARRELGQALVLLRREDASRLLLFGGGFSRAALIALCESALLEYGERP
jgi:chemotaxis protein methyltransferase CheR